MSYLMQVQEKLKSNVLSTEESKSLKGKGCRSRRDNRCGRRGRGRRGRGGCSGGGTKPEIPTTQVNETNTGSIPQIGVSFD